MTYHRYSDEEKNFIVENVKGRSVAELTELFNRRFGLSLTIEQTRYFMKRYKLRNGLDRRFSSGNIPVRAKRFRKGEHSARETEFKKGARPVNYKPLGSERVGATGYVEIKTGEPNKWKRKHTFVWEKANGNVPPGHVVIFTDGNNRNFSLENLILVTRRELAVMNKQRLIYDNGDMTRVGKSLAQIKLLICDRGYGSKKKKNREE
jgi:hypothetical protein